MEKLREKLAFLPGICKYLVSPGDSPCGLSVEDVSEIHRQIEEDIGPGENKKLQILADDVYRVLGEMGALVFEQ